MATRRSSNETRRSTSSTGNPSSTGTATGESTSSRESSAAPARTGRKRTAGSAPQSASVQETVSVSADLRRGMIAEAAYLRAERRGFAPGHEEEDWLAAEKEVDAQLASGRVWGGPQ